MGLIPHALYRSRRAWLQYSQAVVMALSLAGLATAAPGDLDPSFGIGGKVVAPLSNRDNGIFDCKIQSDGRIVAVGYDTNQAKTVRSFAIARFLNDGSFDQTFGTGGKVTINFGGFLEEAHGVAIQPDGKTLVAGF